MLRTHLGAAYRPGFSRARAPIQPVTSASAQLSAPSARALSIISDGSYGTRCWLARHLPAQEGGEEEEAVVEEEMLV